MEIWLDTTDIEAIKYAEKIKALHGVTTNPTLIAHSRKPLEDVVKNILDVQGGPVAVQVVADNLQKMRQQLEAILALSDRVLVKIPVTHEGLELMHDFDRVMATSIYEPLQAMLAFKNKAAYLAPYMGRIQDLGECPLQVMSQMQKIKQNYNYTGKIIAAGIRRLENVLECAERGIDAVTISKELFYALIETPEGTSESVKKFALDWETAHPSELFT